MSNALMIVGAATLGTVGIEPPRGQSDLSKLSEMDGKYTSVLSTSLNAGRHNLYAGHRSHSSHSSHSSHRSHSSGSGSSYRSYSPPPAPYTPPPQSSYTAPASSLSSETSAGSERGSATYSGKSLQPANRANSPASNKLALDPGSSTKPTSAGGSRDADALKLLIMRVQAALYSKGYDPGAIDGTLTQETQTALRAFQRAHGIRVTGTMTTPTLNALGVRL